MFATGSSLPSISLASLAALVTCLATVATAADDSAFREEAQGLFGALQAVPDAALGAADVTLGRALFWDTRVSADSKTACASCHLREDWGADRRRFSPDAKGKLTLRNSQTVFNSMNQSSLRWTGDRKSGAQQAEKSLTGSMGFASPEAGVARLVELGYETAFRTAYPDDAEPVSAANYGRALQAYQATLVTPAPFDRFLAGDDNALTAQQKAGLATFMKNGCADCHSGPLLGGGSLEKFGVAKDYWTATGSEKPDMGRYATTQNEADRYVFRVSPLRNIAKTAPYFHDGSVAKLEQAIQVMADVQLGTRLNDKEVATVAAFLNALTGEVPEHFAPPASRP
jgi:cytochrome c peroxidase